MQLLIPLATGAAIGGGIAAATAKKPKPVDLPPVPELPPAPVLTVGEAGGEEAREQARKRAARRRGRVEIVVAGPLEPVTTKKTLLG